MPRKKKNPNVSETQLNVSTPTSLVRKMENFAFENKLLKKEAYEMVIEVGLEVCKEKLNKKAA